MPAYLGKLPKTRFTVQVVRVAAQAGLNPHISFRPYRGIYEIVLDFPIRRVAEDVPGFTVPAVAPGRRVALKYAGVQVPAVALALALIALVRLEAGTARGHGR